MTRALLILSLLAATGCIRVEVGDPGPGVAAAAEAGAALGAAVGAAIAPPPPPPGYYK